mmetsp:Transcript_5776/g.6665  ORF Transcript_5776/g.6665 Transcript_5776/m.6665 type:complete len:141 (+) Transcript_5776:163-585(+)
MDMVLVVVPAMLIQIRECKVTSRCLHPIQLFKMARMKMRITGRCQQIPQQIRLRHQHPLSFTCLRELRKLFWIFLEKKEFKEVSGKFKSKTANQPILLLTLGRNSVYRDQRHLLSIKKLNERDCGDASYWIQLSKENQNK